MTTLNPKPVRFYPLTHWYMNELADLFRINRDALWRDWTNGRLVLCGRPAMDKWSVCKFFGLRLTAEFGRN